MNRIKTMTILILASSMILFAQSGKDQNTETKENEISEQTNKIFNDIIRNMPKEMRVKVDSASNIDKENTFQSQGIDSQNQQRIQEQKRTNAINELPEYIRERVQKRIQEIENKNEEKALQFKERMKKKNQ